MVENLIRAGAFDYTGALRPQMLAVYESAMDANISRRKQNVDGQLSLFDRFDVFVSGVLDLTGVVYFLSVSGVFLFLTVQSLEKRRWS